MTAVTEDPSKSTVAEELLKTAHARRLVLPARGVEIALLEWPGDGPSVLLHHANGFCKGVWARVAAGLRNRCRVVAMDARGHGDSSRPVTEGAYEWAEVAADLAAVAGALVDEAGAPLGLGVGHSFGGTALLGAAAARPELFAATLLIDPVLPPPPGAVPPELLREHTRGLADSARRRRSVWPSREAARASWAAHPFFASWEPEVLDLYVLDGLRDRSQGGVELKCPGAVEAAVFSATTGVDAIGMAQRIACPTRILWASRGNHPRERYESVAAAMPDGQVESVETGHLVPMESTTIVTHAIDKLLDAEGTPGNDQPVRQSNEEALCE